MAMSFSGSEKTCSGVPSIATRPWSKAMMRSAMRAVSSMLWLTMMTVEPLSLW